MDSEKPLRALFKIFARLWVSNFFIAISAAVFANALWKVPLADVIDVQLSIYFSVIGIILAVYAVIIVGALITQHWAVALGIAFAGILMALSAYAPVLGYKLYAFIPGVEFAGSSRLLNLFESVELFVSQSIAGVFVGVGDYFDFDVTLKVVERALSVMSIGAAVLTYFGTNKPRQHQPAVAG